MEGRHTSRERGSGTRRVDGNLTAVVATLVANVAVTERKQRPVPANTHTVADSGQSVIFIENTEEYRRLEAAFEMCENAT